MALMVAWTVQVKLPIDQWVAWLGTWTPMASSNGVRLQYRLWHCETAGLAARSTAEEGSSTII